MTQPSTASTQYTGFAIFLHWLVALGVFCVVPLGAYMHDLPASPVKFELYAYHKSIGVCILLLMIIRVLWRFKHTPPALPNSMSAKEQMIAHAMAFGMYVLLFTSPLTGYLMSSFFGKAVVVFGLFQLPALVAPSEDMGKLFATLHMISNFTLATLISLHILASLKHHFKDKDAVLARMLPFLAKQR
jgi:cytochrome b561